MQTKLVCRVGSQLLKGDWEAAVKLILAEREGDREDALRARQLFAQGQIGAANRAAPAYMQSEKAILQVVINSLPALESVNKLRDDDPWLRMRPSYTRAFPNHQLELQKSSDFCEHNRQSHLDPSSRLTLNNFEPSFFRVKPCPSHGIFDLRSPV